MNPTASAAVARGQRPRLPFLDWMRGLAVIIILQGHTFHAFSRPDLRTSGPYVLSQFLGGIPPAMFLFLTGITFAFILERGATKGLGWRERLWAAVKRSRYLFLIAFLFRIQLWAFTPQPWQNIFKVDILNCMGLTMLVLAPLALASLEHRAKWSAGIGAAVAIASPLISGLDFSALHPFLRAYMVPSYDYFAFFPWASFLAFGVSAGSIIRSLEADKLNRAAQWAALVGFALVLGGQYFSNLPYTLYEKSEFWLNSPGLIVIKLGVLLLLLSLSYIWTEYVTRDRWSWVRQLGTTSLLVYWVHIELVYGWWCWFWKEQLNNYQAGLVSAALILAMIALSLAKTKVAQLDWKALKVSLYPRSSATNLPRVSHKINSAPR